MEEFWEKARNIRLERFRTLGISLAVLLLFVFTGAHGSAKSRGFRKAVPSARLEVLGFYENDLGGMYGSSKSSLKKNIDSIDTVVGIWASVDWRGNIAAVTSDRAILDFVHEHNRPMLVAVGNLKGDATLSNSAMFDTPELRERTVQNIATFVINQGYDGAHIIFDMLPPSANGAFADFIEELGLSLHSANKMLGVSVFPKNELPSSLWGAFDTKRIGESADYVVLQAYERHRQNGLPGPISPDPWVEKAVAETLESIPPQKLMLGVGFYGYSWPVNVGETASEYLPTREALARASRYGARVQIDPESNQPHYTCEHESVLSHVWYQDSNSLLSKIRVAKSHRLRGISLWRLGFETNDCWDVIRDSARK